MSRPFLHPAMSRRYHVRYNHPRATMLASSLYLSTDQTAPFL
jgi:hypothetical protein